MRHGLNNSTARRMLRLAGTSVGRARQVRWLAHRTQKGSDTFCAGCSRERYALSELPSSSCASSSEDMSAGAREGFPYLHRIIKLRSWLDRRLSRRTRVDRPATIHAGSGSCQAVVRDISSGGAGLEKVEDLAVGETVVITIDDMGNLRGEVRWRSGARAGVKLIMMS